MVLKESSIIIHSEENKTEDISAQTSPSLYRAGPKSKKRFLKKSRTFLSLNVGNTLEVEKPLIEETNKLPTEIPVGEHNIKPLGKDSEAKDKPEASEAKDKPEASDDKDKPEASDDKEKPEASDDKEKPEASGDEEKPEEVPTLQREDRRLVSTQIPGTL